MHSSDTPAELPRPQPLWRISNPKVLLQLALPVVRACLLRSHRRPAAQVQARHHAAFTWDYQSTRPQLQKLFKQAKASQWDADTALDWSMDVDPQRPDRELLSEARLPMAALPSFRNLPTAARRAQAHGFLSWLLSQFLHGEQGALLAACQVVEAVQWVDGKMYGSTQVMDEGRHIEVFHRYLHDKLQKFYPVNDNLFAIMDSLLGDRRWDMKFLGMQILVEGLALGAFGVLRHNTSEPLLKELLRRVITDEARHVHFGVTALAAAYASLSEPQRREREDWAFEVCILMRNRFLAHEFYDEFYGHLMSRQAWNALAHASPYMRQFREEMFRRLVPNLRRIGLLSARIRPHYAALGLLQYEHEPDALQRDH